MELVVTDYDRAHQVWERVRHHWEHGYWLGVGGGREWLDEDHPPTAPPALVDLPDLVLAVRLQRVVPVVATPQGQWQPVVVSQPEALAVQRVRHVLYEVEFQVPQRVEFRALGVYRYAVVAPGVSERVVWPAQVHLQGLEAAVYHRRVVVEAGGTYRVRLLREIG